MIEQPADASDIKGHRIRHAVGWRTTLSASARAMRGDAGEANGVLRGRKGFEGNRRVVRRRAFRSVHGQREAVQRLAPVCPRITTARAGYPLRLSRRAVRCTRPSGWERGVHRQKQAAPRDKLRAVSMASADAGPADLLARVNEMAADAELRRMIGPPMAARSWPQGIL